MIAHRGVHLAWPRRGVAPGIRGAVGAPGHPLPLGFGGQTSADPEAELRCLERRHVDDGEGAVTFGEVRVAGRFVGSGALLGLYAVTVLLVGDFVNVCFERQEGHETAVAYDGRAACDGFLRAGRYGLVLEPG